MTQDTQSNILRQKVLWIEIRAKQEEYKRISKQIQALEESRNDIISDIQKRVNESQKIADWLLGKELG